MPARPSRRFGPWVGPASPPHLFRETNPFCGAPRALQPATCANNEKGHGMLYALKTWVTDAIKT
jgi:hypothetical protein